MAGFPLPEIEGAEVFYGDEAHVKAIARLESVGLPSGLLPLQDVTECGYVKETGYVWIKQKKEIRHVFKLIGRQVSYGPEIRGYVQAGRLRSLTGVKAKELFIWAPIGDISVDPAVAEKISFKSFGGISKTFPVVAFAKGQ